MSEQRLYARYLVIGDAEREISQVLPLNAELSEVLSGWIFRQKRIPPLRECDVRHLVTAADLGD